MLPKTRVVMETSRSCHSRLRNISENFLAACMQNMLIVCIFSLMLGLLCTSHSTSLPASGYYRRTNRLRGMSRPATQALRNMKKRQYYSGGPKGLQAFVLECEVQLKAKVSDGMLSPGDFARFLLDYCENSDFPGPACQSANTFWSLDPRLQMIFASEYCGVGPQEQIDCVNSFRTSEQVMGYHGDTEPLCESTYRFLKPSGIISSMLKNEDFTDSPVDKKKKKKGSATKVSASSFTSEPTQEPTTTKAGRDSFSPPTVAPTYYTPPAFIEGVIKPGVLVSEERSQGRVVSNSVSFGFGATILLMLVGTVLIVLLIRRIKYSDSEPASFDPALEGDASILSENSFMFRDRPQVPPDDTTQDDDKCSVNHSCNRENTFRFWKGKTLGMEKLWRWKNRERNSTIGQECHTLPPLPTMVSDCTDIQHISVSLERSDDSQSAEMSPGADHPLDLESTLMRDEFYMNEFMSEGPEASTFSSDPTNQAESLESFSLPSISTTSNTDDNTENACSVDAEESVQPNEGANIETLVSMRPNLANFVRQMKAQLETCNGRQKTDEQSSTLSATTPVKPTVHDLKSQFERKHRDEENSSLDSPKGEPAAPTVKDLRSQFQTRLQESGASTAVVVGIHKDEDKPSVKNLRGQFEPPCRRNKRRTTSEMSSQLQNLRKQFE